MSGAAEGLAGLAISAISVAALFTTCIECFDIVIAGKNFSEDFEQLCTLRVQFGLWGESVGLIPEPNNGRRLKYDKNIDRPDIRPGVERTLNNIKSLLEEGARINKKYGMQVFKGSFDRFKSRIKTHQRDISAWKMTSWAVHDARKFESLVDRLRKYVDGLESITNSLGLLEDQHARLRQEIDSISYVESLRLLRDASSTHANSAAQDIADTASNRTVTIVEGKYTAHNFVTFSPNYDSTLSFKTTCTRQSTDVYSIPDPTPQPPEAWPQSLWLFTKRMDQETHFKPSMTCQGCREENHRCVVEIETSSCVRCIQTRRKCIFSENHLYDLAGFVKAVSQVSDAMNGLPAALATNQPSQNQRLMQNFIAVTGLHQPLSFSSGNAHYGDRLATIKNEDTQYWLQNSAKFITAAQVGPAVLKRIFLDLRDIRRANVPFISAVPVNGSLDTILASIEGPPETPYEGGAFWIAIRIPDRYPSQLPLMRFNTEIYHPNISPQGDVCYADGHLHGSSHLPNMWYSEHKRKLNWSVGSLLTALCGLLSSLDVTDPLVPEIARAYLENYNEYCSNARLYTRKYATNQRPDESQLVFLEDSSTENDTPEFVNHPKTDEPDSDWVSLNSLQASLREEYDAQWC